ncbi:MAG: hypothetical protein AMJ79_05255 [Phycisphaerae bacterium SM23_30]|nr:MAG: hypothetical protein AMJ79_05255 [Phycisphaerae bacterium SM23_30]
MPGIWRKLRGPAWVLFIMMILGGCHGMKRFNVVVTADQSISDRTVEIDLVGVNRYDLQRWNSMELSKYWTRGNPERENASKYTIKFGVSEQGEPLPSEQILKKNHDIWKEWRDNRVTHLFVLAHLPGLHEDRPGSADNRRVSVPLEKECWGWFAGKIEIKVNYSNVNCITLPPKCPIE